MKIPSWFPWLGFLASLRARLILLVLLAILPMLGLILYTDLEHRRQDVAQIQTDALNIARMSADAHRSHLENTQQLLATLALLPQIRGADPAPCNELLARILNQSPLYANLAVAAPNGDVFCSAISPTTLVNYADRLNFNRALETRAFAVGGYQIGRISHRASLAVNYPVLDAAGNVERVLVAGLDLAWINQYSTDVVLPPGSRLAIIDRAGVILVHQPDPETWVGKSVADVEIVKTALAQGEGTTNGLGLDNTPGLSAFTPLDSAVDAAAFLLISIPRATAFVQQDALLHQNLFALATVTVLGLLIAWLFGNWFIVRRVKALVNATQRLAAGDLAARTQLPYGIGELSELARCFDAMAHALEQHDAQQKKIQEALSQAETQYHSLVEQLPVFVYRVEFGHDGKWLYASPQIEKFLGFTAAELMADKDLWRRQLHPDDVPLAIDPAKASQITGQPFQTEYRMFARDGRIVWVRDEAIVIPAAEHPAYLQGIMTDVTAHRQSEQAIHESEERFRTFIEQTSEGVMLIDEQARIIEYNPALAEITGIPRAQALGQQVWDFQYQLLPAEQQTPVVKQRHAAAIQQLVNTGQSALLNQPFQTSICRADGTVRILEQRFFVIQTARGYRVGNVARDVTAQKRIERELQNERDFVLQVVNTMGQGLTVTNEEGRFIFVNPAYARMTGYSVADLLGKRPSDVTAPASRDTLFQAYAERLAGKTTTYESRFQRADGSQVRVLITGAPRMQDGKYNGAIAVVTDLTERIQMEQALRESQRQLALVLEGSNDGFWDWNIASGAVQYSERWASMLGYRLDELEASLTTWERLIHPDDLPMVQRVLQDHLEGVSPYYETEHRLRAQSGEWKWVLDRGKIVERDETGKPLRAAGTQTDITERVKAQEQLLYLGTHDALTRLYNRAHFESELARLEQSRQLPVSVVMIDVDGLKQVNDRLGHLAGDALLQRAAAVLSATFRAEDVIARIGGDEFAVLLPHTDAHTASEIRLRLHRQLDAHNVPYPNQPLSLSIGVATALPGGALGEAVRQADAQMYREKEKHRKN